MALLVYSIPLAAAWGFWGVVHVFGWHPVIDYIAFGIACVATALVLVIAALETGMRG